MGRIGFDIMCGIAGFSLSTNSKVNSRKLAHALLCEIESRGSQASGFAFDHNGSQGVFKSATRGSNLSLKALPKRASTVILHTRYATHGSTKVNSNNHPVTSPDSTISLVHNGVIYNHDVVRSHLPEFTLPEVDSSVIPAILQSSGVERFDMLDGDAAVAWLDSNAPGVLNIARVSHSPLWACQLIDGSLVFASTEHLLRSAISKLKLTFSFIAELPELSMWTVRNGRIDAVDRLPDTAPEFEYVPSYASTSAYRAMTAGEWRDGASVDAKSDPWYWDETYAPASGSSLFNDEWDGEWAKDEFDQFLIDYIEMDGRFYDYSGVYIGDYEYMRELFESHFERHYSKRNF